MITHNRVRELLDYKDGELFWRENGPSRKRGCRAGGSMSGSGYKMVRLDRRLYNEHYIVYMWHNAEKPSGVIDHINRDKTDNRIENLRCVTHAKNITNTERVSKTKCGVAGVHWDSFTNSWKPVISVNGRMKNIRRTKSLDEAVMARWSAEVEQGYLNAFTTSSAYNYLIGKGLIKRKEHRCL